MGDIEGGWYMVGMIKDDVMVYHVMSRDVRNPVHVRSIDKCIRGKRDIGPLRITLFIDCF